MKVLWTSPHLAAELIVIDATIAIIENDDVVGIDATGAERWRRTFARTPRHLTRCGSGVAFPLAQRGAPTQIMALDLDGNDRWRFDRPWTLLFDGIDGDDRGLVLFGQDVSASVNHWIGLDATTGVVAFDATPPPVHGAPKLAGAWLHAPIADGTEGELRADRDGTHPMTLTPLDHMASASNRELLLIEIRPETAASEVVAIEVATGRERWRAPGGHNLEIALDDRRAAWVERETPVVYDLATGTSVWRGATLPPTSPNDDYRCTLGPGAVVCHVGFTSVVYYSLAAEAPLRMVDRSSDGRFLGAHFVESGDDAITCWELA